MKVSLPTSNNRLTIQTELPSQPGLEPDFLLHFLNASLI